MNRVDLQLVAVDPRARAIADALFELVDRHLFGDGFARADQPACLIHAFFKRVRDKEINRAADEAQYEHQEWNGDAREFQSRRAAIV